MRIVLDAGHGPNTLGKRSPDGTLREYVFNSDVARKAADLLAAYEGVETLLTFEDGRDVSLAERTNRANAWKADLFVSIHANASGDRWSLAQGIETYIYTKASAASQRLANIVQQRIVAVTGLLNRGVKKENFHVLRETRMPAILVECGFMTHRQEIELLKSNEYRQRCAKAIVQGIVQYGALQRKKCIYT